MLHRRHLSFRPDLRAHHSALALMMSETDSAIAQVAAYYSFPKYFAYAAFVDTTRQAVMRWDSCVLTMSNVIITPERKWNGYRLSVCTPRHLGHESPSLAPLEAFRSQAHNHHASQQPSTKTLRQRLHRTLNTPRPLRSEHDHGPPKALCGHSGRTAVQLPWQSNHCRVTVSDGYIAHQTSKRSNGIHRARDGRY